MEAAFGIFKLSFLPFYTFNHRDKSFQGYLAVHIIMEYEKTIHNHNTHKRVHIHTHKFIIDEKEFILIYSYSFNALSIVDGKSYK